MALRLGTLVSGRGSNLAAVLEAIAAGSLGGVEPVMVISNRAGVPALAVAARHGVPTVVCESVVLGGRNARDAAIGSALTDAGVGLALLAGFDRILGPAYFAAYGGDTINIHPSLLPRHGGPGMLGDAVHAAVLAGGETVSGATVHRVTTEVDAGPILGQVVVAVEVGDTVGTLASRVAEAEHRLVVDVLRALAAGGGSLDPSASMAAAPRPGTETPAPH